MWTSSYYKLLIFRNIDYIFNKQTWVKVGGIQIIQNDNDIYKYYIEVLKCIWTYLLFCKLFLYFIHILMFVYGISLLSLIFFFILLLLIMKILLYLWLSAPLSFIQIEKLIINFLAYGIHIFVCCFNLKSIFPSWFNGCWTLYVQ